ncbi:MAG: polyprenyl synthetase family protein [Bacteroides sp.]|nr:polyprenyl synthetase family protein [Roseburia sp.]MCM1347226.1 polyprenyl synthetase family protein [Bacteroides sp.]MCM1421698.1 polyprenyl synthetase family protein [Bacteroides sp.]
MNSLQQIRKPIEQEMERYGEVFDSCLKHKTPFLNEVLRMIGARKGKMMRPMLTLLSAKLFGEVGEAAIYAAAAFEFFHTASLVHDDVVDESDKRRGQLSVNSAYGNKVAVLIGDYVLTNSLLNAAATGNLHFVEMVSMTAQRLVDGELLQLNNVHNTEISEEVYLNIIDNKTAALFASCCESGAVASGASDDDVANMRAFGEIVGRCFQIRDDIFDYEHDESIGKPTGNDMKEGKLTLPVIYALQSRGDKDMLRLARKVKDGLASAEEIERLVAFTKSSGGIDYAVDRMNRYAGEAKGLLARYPDSEVRRSLVAFVDYVVERRV